MAVLAGVWVVPAASASAPGGMPMPEPRRKA